MSFPRKSSPRKTRKKKNTSWIVSNFRKILAFILLFSLLIISICTVGYVIFFRTVFAAEINQETERKSPVVFEEPDPPVHENIDLIDGAGAEVAEKSTENEKLPQVAIIIDDIGYHESLDERFLHFPFQLTYSFLPFAPFTGELVEQANNLGKTLLLHLPLEPKDKRWSSGPGTIYLKDEDARQIEKFEESLARVPGVIGVNNHMGSLFTEDDASMRRLIEQIDKHNLFFIDSYTTAASTGLRIAGEMGVQTARRHIFLDNILNVNSICMQLEKLIKVAEGQGSGIGIGHPHPETIDALTSCMPLYEQRVQYVTVDLILE
jgi:polysaccharide deacetylase 2 family uncharacterized protein YibQ